jgi:hypothetical protein
VGGEQTSIGQINAVMNELNSLLKQSVVGSRLRGDDVVGAAAGEGDGPLDTLLQEVMSEIVAGAAEAVQMIEETPLVQAIVEAGNRAAEDGDGACRRDTAAAAALDGPLTVCAILPLPPPYDPFFFTPYICPRTGFANNVGELLDASVRRLNNLLAFQRSAAAAQVPSPTLALARHLSPLSETPFRPPFRTLSTPLSPRLLTRLAHILLPLHIRSVHAGARDGRRGREAAVVVAAARRDGASVIRRARRLGPRGCQGRGRTG